MRESCSVAGIATEAIGPSAAWVSEPSVISSDSSTALVSSSMNNGTPSVRAMICSRTASGSVRPPVRSSISAIDWARDSRPSASMLACPMPTQPGSYSGRAVTTASTRRSCSRSTMRSSSSRVVGSAQCASSNTHSTGRSPARSASWLSRLSKVRAFCWCGVSVRGGNRSSVETDSSAASGATASPSTDPRPRFSRVSSLSSFAGSSSPASKPAARSSCAMNGWSALFVRCAEHWCRTQMCAVSARHSRSAFDSRDLPGAQRPAARSGNSDRRADSVTASTAGCLMRRSTEMA